MSLNKDAVGKSVRGIMDTTPPGVLLIAAAKTRLVADVQAAIDAGVTHIGYNYVQEAIPIIWAVFSALLTPKISIRSLWCWATKGL